VYSDKAQMTWKCGKNKEVCYRLQGVVWLIFLLHCDVLCALSEYKHTAKWKLFFIPCFDIATQHKIRIFLMFVVMICTHRTLWLIAAFVHLFFNPLSPHENEISLNVITTCLNVQVTRIKEVITQDKMSWYLDISPYWFHNKCMEISNENMHFYIRA